MTMLRESLRIAEEIGDPEHRCRACVNLSHVLWLAGDLPASLATAQHGLEVALEAGLGSSWGFWLRGNVGDVHLLLGHHKAAARLVDEVARTRPVGLPAALNGIDRARLATLAGRFDEAEQLLASIAEPTGDDVNILLSYFELSAELAMWQRRPDVAQEVLDRAVELLGATDKAWLLPPVLAWAVAAVADASGASPDDDAISTFHERVADQHRSETQLPPVQRPWMRVVHAELSRLQATPDPALWDQAAQDWDRLSIPYLAAYCRFRQAEAVLVTDGPRSRATVLLRAAHQTSSRLEARALREEIEALAGRGRIDLDTPVVTEQEAGRRTPGEELGLSPREWEVLRHVALGATNAQIATKLFIADKTVERHVTRILSKLGAANRVEAAGVLHRLSARPDTAVKARSAPTP